MLIEARRIVVEQARDIGLGKRLRRFADAEQRQPRAGALRVARIGAKRRAERLGRAGPIAELFPRFAEREPCRRPVGRALERLLQHFSRGAPVAVLGGGPRVGVAAKGEKIAAG